MNYKERSLSIIATLEPIFAQKVRLWFETCYFNGIPIYIYCGIRTPNEQSQEYAKGRTTQSNVLCKCEKINGKCKKHPLGLPTTSAKAFESWHQYGLALDFCLVDRGGRVSWAVNADFNQDKQKDYAQVIKLAKERGLESGATFPKVDMPHIQDRYNLTIKEAKKRLLSGDLVNGFIRV